MSLAWRLTPGNEPGRLAAKHRPEATSNGATAAVVRAARFMDSSTGRCFEGRMLLALRANDAIVRPYLKLTFTNKSYSLHPVNDGRRRPLKYWRLEGKIDSAVEP